MLIAELAEVTGTEPRQIRWLIAEGIVPGPGGTRSRPEYGPEHVRAILHYRDERRRGLSPAQVKAVLRERARETAGLELRLAPGVTLRIEPEALEALDALDPHEVGRRVAEELGRAMGNKTGGADDAT